jgi:nucleoside-diphosphate-sugar epimerase
MRTRCILITGAAGRLGSDLVGALGPNHDLVYLDVVPPKHPGRGRTVIGSINDRSAVARALEGVDTVIHAAAIPGDIPDRYRMIETNVLGTFNMLEAAGASDRVERFIYMSSICWHGITDTDREAHRPHYLPFDENHPSLAFRYYSCSKVEGEFWCRKYVERFGKPVVAVRPALIVPLGKQGRLTAKSNHPYSILYDYVGAGDLIDGIVRLLDYHPKDGFDRFLFHAPDQLSRTPSLELAAKIFPGVPVDREKLSRCEGFGAFVDCAHAKEVLGWNPVFRCSR